jgi:holo-[acyl-carrier protein] synthase
VIYGIGTDICAVARMESLLARYGGRPGRRILTDAEQADLARAHSPARFLAKRFAAKEAFSKAMGTGFRSPVTLHSVGVGHDPHGKPVLEFAPALAELMNHRRLRAHVSITDEQDFAVAFVVVEQEN